MRFLIIILISFLTFSIGKTQSPYEVWTDSMIVNSFSGSANLTLVKGDLTLTKFQTLTGDTLILVVNTLTGTIDTVPIPSPLWEVVGGVLQPTTNPTDLEVLGDSASLLIGSESISGGLLTLDGAVFYRYDSTAVFLNGVFVDDIGEIYNGSLALDTLTLQGSQTIARNPAVALINSFNILDPSSYATVYTYQSDGEAVAIIEIDNEEKVLIDSSYTLLRGDTFKVETNRLTLDLPTNGIGKILTDIDGSGTAEWQLPSSVINTLYSADDTIGAGRVATLTDNFEISGTTSFIIDKVPSGSPLGLASGFASGGFGLGTHNELSVIGDLTAIGYDKGFLTGIFDPADGLASTTIRGGVQTINKLAGLDITVQQFDPSATLPSTLSLESIASAGSGDITMNIYSTQENTGTGNAILNIIPQITNAASTGTLSTYFVADQGGLGASSHIISNFISNASNTNDVVGGYSSTTLGTGDALANFNANKQTTGGLVLSRLKAQNTIDNKNYSVAVQVDNGTGNVVIGDIDGGGAEYYLPIARGINGDILKTDGSGIVTWQQPSIINTLYSADDTIGAGRVATLTDNFEISGTSTLRVDKDLSPIVGFTGIEKGGLTGGQNNSIIGFGDATGFGLTDASMLLGIFNPLGNTQTTLINHTIDTVSGDALTVINVTAEEAGKNGIAGFVVFSDVKEGSGDASNFQASQITNNGTGNATSTFASLIDFGSSSSGLAKTLISAAGDAVGSTSVVEIQQAQNGSLSHSIILTDSNISVGDSDLGGTEYYLPWTRGTNNQALITDGSGVATWQIPSIVYDTTPQLGGTLDANSNNIDMGVNTITDPKVGQWDSAYSWGDHALVGYLDGFIVGNSSFIDLQNVGTPTEPDITATLSATGVTDATTFLRGDNTWATPQLNAINSTVDTFGVGIDTVSAVNNFRIIKTFSAPADADTIYIEDVTGSQFNGYELHFKEYNGNTSNNWYIATIGTDKIDGSDTYPMDAAGKSVTLFWFNDEWFIE